MGIGDFVRSERKRQGLTQQQLAARSGVGLNFVYQLEKNKASVQLDSVNQVLRALGYQIGVIRDFRPWDQDCVQRAGATAAGAEELETGDRFLPAADL
jgi:y4mF family transcriptional regulator